MSQHIGCVLPFHSAQCDSHRDKEQTVTDLTDGLDLDDAADSTKPTSLNQEISAMRRIATSLDRLDPAARERVVSWAFDRFHQPVKVDDEQSA